MTSQQVSLLDQLVAKNGETIGNPSHWKRYDDRNFNNKEDASLEGDDETDNNSVEEESQADNSSGQDVTEDESEDQDDNEGNSQDEENPTRHDSDTHDEDGDHQPLVSCGGHFARRCEECTKGNGASWCNGGCEWNASAKQCQSPPHGVHPIYGSILKNRPFQAVTTEKGNLVNILLVKMPMDGESTRVYHKYKDKILFLGISSFENYPLSSPNPFSANFSNDLYRGLFPGFLTMMHHPEEYFDERTKSILLSQSDFNLEDPLKFGRQHDKMAKRWDFAFSGTDQDVDNDCIGWSSFAKNWTFVLEALEVMCSPEFNLTGVLVATKNKPATKACSLPDACKGKMVQTTFLPNQTKFFEYVKSSHFVFLPQIYDASPRVSSQALSLDVPVLMNRNIVGGWKYLNEKTGEFFHDMSDFKKSLRRIVDRSRAGNYHPRTWIEEHHGTEKAGKKLRDFVETNFPDRVQFPPNTRLLIPSGS